MASTVSRPRATQGALLLLDVDWSRGQIRDAPRGAIPEGGVFNSVDYNLHRPGLAQKRGGTAYAGPAMTGATYAHTVAYMERPAGAQLLAVGENGHLYTVTSGTTTDVDSSSAEPIEPPKLWVGAGKTLMVFTRRDGTSGPRKWSGSAGAALGGSPPAGRFSCIYKGRLCLGGNNANPDRLFFSPVPDIESTWDTTNSWVSTTHPITGLAALQNAIVIFSERHTQRITGSTPPPDSDFDLSPVGDIGCTDARSIVVYENNAIFANPRGVYSTNGNSFQNLTQLAGNESYWQSLFSGYTRADWTIASGVYQSYLFVSVMNASSFVDCLVFNLARPAWWRHSNIKAAMFASTVGAQDELYYADRSTNRVVAMSGLFSPSGSNKADADGTAVTPVLETRLLGGGPTLKHFGHMRLSMDMRDAASDNPSMAVTVAPGLEATTFAAVSGSPLSESTDNNRYPPMNVGHVAQGITVKFVQTNASSKTEIYALEVDVRALQPIAGGLGA